MWSHSLKMSCVGYFNPYLELRGFMKLFEEA
jgi:hypothetical protein